MLERPTTDKRSRANERTRSMAPPDDAKAATRRRRRALDTARCRYRQQHGLEIGEREFDLAIRYGGLREDQITNKTAVNTALGRLLRKALVALLEQEDRKQKK